MKILVSCLFGLFAATLYVKGEELTASWFHQVEADYSAHILEISSAHETGVRALFETLKKEARIADAITVRDYLKRFVATRNLLPADVVDAPIELQRLQQDFLAKKQTIAYQVGLPRYRRH